MKLIQSTVEALLVSIPHVCRTMKYLYIKISGAKIKLNTVYREAGSTQVEMDSRNVQWFGGGLLFEACILVYHSA